MIVKRKSKIIIDAHTHLGYWPTLNSSLNNLLSSMINHGITFSIVSFDGTEFKEGDRFTKLIPQIEASKKIFALSKKYSNLIPLVWIRPHTEKNIEELDAFLSKHNAFFHGLKFHPYTSRLRISDPRLYPYFDLAIKYNYPILVHTATDKYSKLKYLIEVCKKYPNINFIAAHAVLTSDHTEIIPYLKSLNNLYMDTAWLDISFINILKEEKLMDKVMFGTDNPIDGERTLSEEIYENYFNNVIKLPKKDYQKLMYLNASKLYNIKLD